MNEPAILELLLAAIRSERFVRAGFAGTPRDRTASRWSRVSARPIVVRGER